MKIRFTSYIGPYLFPINISVEGQEESLIELSRVFSSRHVIEAYKEVQQRYPDLFPPLQEKQ